MEKRSCRKQPRTPSKGSSMKRSIVIAIVASAFALPAQAGDFFTWPPTNNGIIHYGDEDDLSWMYVPPTAKPAFDTDRPGTPRPYVEFGDENNLSWLYTPPTAKPAFDTDLAGTPKHFVEFGDENDFGWLYEAPTAKYAEP